MSDYIGTTPLPERYMTSVNQFSYDEKFDTWLNLGAWHYMFAGVNTPICWEDVKWPNQKKKLTNLDIAICKQEELSILDVVSTKLSPLLPALLIDHCFKTPPTKSHVMQVHYRKFMNISDDAAVKAFQLQLQHMHTGVGPDLYEKLHVLSPNWTDIISSRCPYLTGFMHLHEDLLRVVNLHKVIAACHPSKHIHDSLQKMNTRSKVSFYLPSIKANLTIAQTFMILKWKGYNWMVPIPYFLEIYNKISEMISYLKYNLIQSQTIYPTEHYQFSMDFLKILCKYMLRHKYLLSPSLSHDQTLVSLIQENKAFIFLKAIEGLGVAQMIYRSDKKFDWVNSQLGTTLWKALRDDKIVPEDDWQTSEIFQLFERATLPQISGVMGTVKLCGHPSIEVYKGLNKLYERTHSHINVDNQFCDRARGIITRDIIKTYYRIHGSYPNIKQSSFDHVPLLGQLIRQHLSINSEEGSQLWQQISTDDWAKVILGQNAELDRVDNQIMLLKDKALGLTRSKIMRRLMLQDADKPSGRDYRRALLAYLFDPYFDKGFKNYLNKYIDQDEWTNAVLDYMVIKLTPKELEEKPEGRMFGASPPYERNRRVVQEANVMSFMDQYISEQLLTPNELTIMKKLYSFRYLRQAHPDSYILNISFDFSKWNNNMRHESVDVPAGAVLDNWFNTSLFSKTMKAFEHMFIYYQDDTYEQYWDGQLGGIEGLNQATWTLTFVGGLKDALERLGYVYHLTVKGDDVRCALVLPKNQVNRYEGVTLGGKIEQIRDILLGALRDLCSAMGWELNPQESFVSLSLICTSKQYQINDTWLPADSKKIMKLEAISNVAFPTLEDMISNIFSIAHSTCSQSPVVIPSFLTAVWTASKLLVRTMMNQGERKLLKEKAIAMLIWPQILGGPGALPLQTYFVRGENDMLAVSISLLRFARYTTEGPLRKIISYILHQKINRRDNKVMLASDPYAIDIDCPIRPQAIIKQYVKSGLRNFCQHKEIKKLVTLRAERDKDTFLTTLATLNPYYAKIATALWECSPYYLVEEILAKFLNSASILGFITKGHYYNLYSYSGQKLIRDLNKASKARITYWRSTMNGINVASPDHILGVPIDRFDNLDICTTAIVHDIREACWGRPILGITYPSLVDQVKLLSDEDTRLLSFHNNWDIQTTYSQVNIRHREAKYQLDINSHHYASIPGSIPWLGSETQSSVRLPFQSENIASPVMRKIRRLLTLLSSADIFGKDFENIILKMLGSYTELPIGHLRILCAEEGGGHLAHRTPINSYSMVTMPNFRPNISQIITIHNEDILELALDRRNKTINFAARHFFLVALSTLPLQWSMNLPEQYPDLLYSCFHHDNTSPTYKLCPYCANVVEDARVRIENVDDISFDKFNNMTIVQCNESEYEALHRAVRLVLKKGVLEIAIRQELNIDNPIVIQQATASLVNKLVASLGSALKTIKTEGISINPNSQVMDILFTGLNIKAVTGKSIAISVLRCCKPEYLYASLLAEFLWHSIFVSYSTDGLFVGSPLGPLTADHYGPMGPVFLNLSQAGILNNISYVAARNPPIGVEAVDIIWKHGYEQHGGIASRSFFQAVWPLYNKWLTTLLLPDIVKAPQISAPDIQHITANINQQQKISTRLTYHFMHMFFVQDDGSTRTTLRHFQANHTREIGPDYDDELTPPFIHRQVNAWMPTHLFRLVLILLVPLWLRNEEFDELTIRQYVRSGQKVSIMDYNDSIVDIEMLNSLLLIDATSALFTSGLNYITKTCPVIHTDSHRNTFKNTIISLYKQLLTIDRDYHLACIEDFCNLIEQISILHKRTFYISCLETDMRLIKQKFNDLTILEIEEQYPHIQIRQYNPNQNMDNHRAYTPATCSLMHVYGHINNTGDFTTCKFLDFPEAWIPYWNHLTDVVSQLRPPHRDWGNQISPHNIYRIFGGVNKACTKLIPILWKTGIRSHLESLRPGVVICVGDGGGGISALLLRIFPQCYVVMSSLHNRDGDIRAGNDGYLNELPVEFQSSLITDDERSRLIYKGFFPGDVAMLGVQNAISTAVGQIKPRADLLISDIFFEGSTEAQWITFAAILRLHLTSCYMTAPLILRLNGSQTTPTAMALYTLNSIYSHIHILQTTMLNPDKIEVIVMVSSPIQALKVTNWTDNLLKSRLNHQMPLSTLALIRDTAEKVIVIKDDQRYIEGYSGVEMNDSLLHMDNDMIDALWLSPIAAVLEHACLSSCITNSCLGKFIQRLQENVITAKSHALRGCPGTISFRRIKKNQDELMKDVTSWIEHLMNIIRQMTFITVIMYNDIISIFERVTLIISTILDEIARSAFNNETLYQFEIAHGTLYLRLLQHPDQRMNLIKIIMKTISISIRFLCSVGHLSNLLQFNGDDQDVDLIRNWSGLAHLCEHCEDELQAFSRNFHNLPQLFLVLRTISIRVTNDGDVVVRHRVIPEI